MAAVFPPDTGASNDAVAMRRAGRELLSLALMDVRNHTLQLLAVFEKAQAEGLAIPCIEELELPLWLAGHVGWLAEYWIGRNPQRALGSHCPPDAMRLASIDPAADQCFDPALVPHAQRWRVQLPTAESVRAFLLETLESTLELLEKTPDEDDALYFYRAALFHEELRHEQLLEMAQTVGMALAVQLPAGMQAREPVLVPAGAWTLGTSPDGFVFGIEKWAHEVGVPEFEIDAQPVNWSQYIEFVDEDGYDREEVWRPEGWKSLQRQASLEGRRGPRHVEQIGSAGGAARQSFFGKPTRMAASQSVIHVSWWEADAYARWAGPRLPTGGEWDKARHVARRQGFRWG